MLLRTTSGWPVGSKTQAEREGPLPPLDLRPKEDSPADGRAVWPPRCGLGNIEAPVRMVWLDSARREDGASHPATDLEVAGETLSQEEWRRWAAAAGGDPENRVRSGRECPSRQPPEVAMK